MTIAYLDSVNKAERYSVSILAFKNLKISNKKDTQLSKAKSKVWMRFFEVKVQQGRCGSYNYNLKCKKPQK